MDEGGKERESADGPTQGIWNGMGMRSVCVSCGIGCVMVC